MKDMTPERPMTPAEIAELRRLCEAATPGGWQEGRAGICDVVHFDGDDVRGVAWVNGEANRAFVIAARAALPALLDERERLRVERDAHRTDAENLHREGGPARRELRLLKAEHAKATSDRDRLRALLAEAVGIAGLQDDEVTPEIRERLAAIAREGGLT